MAPADWRILPSSKPNKPLLVQTDFGSTEYIVRVTDINSVWSETLDRVGLVRRAKDVESDINPEEDPSQMRILLKKIEDTLHHGDNSQVFVRTISGRIELFLTIPLPGGLSDLQWTIQLEKQPASALQAHVINPSLALAFMQKQQIEDLTNKLKDKDAAISKVLDKVESMGLDFGTLFPTARLNRRLDQRKQIFQQVPGLSVFDKEKWRANASTLEAEGASPISVLQEALEHSSSEAVNALAQRLPVAAEGRSPTPARIGDLSADGTRPVKTKEESQSQPSGFERQPTPPKQRQPDAASSSPVHERGAKQSSRMPSPPAKPPTAAEDESTEDEGDLDSGFQRQPSPPRRQKPALPEPEGPPSEATGAPTRLSSSPAKKRKLGKLRTKATSAPERSASSTPGPSVDKRSDRLQQTASRTPSPRIRRSLPSAGKSNEAQPEDARGVSASTTSASEEPEPPPQPQQPPKKLGKLGKIGSKRAADADVDTSSRNTSVQAKPESEDVPMKDASEAPPTPKKKLGKIGARPASSKGPASSNTTGGTLTSREADDGDVAPSVEAKEETPAPLRPPRPATPEVEETAEEKADRKRQALKQNLDAAKPAGKKKRRF